MGLTSTATAVAVQDVLRPLMLVLLPIFVLLRVNKVYPFVQAVYTGLVRTVTPETAELARLSSKPVTTRSDGLVEDFRIPTNSDLQLRQVKVTPFSWSKLHFADHLSQLFLLLLATLVGPIVSATMSWINPHSTANYSALVILLAVTGAHCINTLVRLLWQSSSSLLLASGFFVFFFTLILSLTAGHLFDIPLEEEYGLWELEWVQQISAAQAPTTSDDNLPTPASDPVIVSRPSPADSRTHLRTILLLASAMAGVLAAALALPALRLARNFVLSRTVPEPAFLYQTGPITMLLAPLGICLTFFTPIADALHQQGLATSDLIALRATLALLALASQFGSLRPSMQYYLNSAFEKGTALLRGQGEDDHVEQEDESTASTSKKAKKKAKTKTSTASPTATVRAGQIQQTVEHVWQYSIVVALQLLLPATLLFVPAAIALIKLGWPATSGSSISTLNATESDDRASPDRSAFIGQAAQAMLLWLSAVLSAFQIGAIVMLQKIQNM
ncbi:uncharacterized protein MONBRDRAFT_27787 [Monosiga brevicollis MX1]|uniref:Uncharacterized protein n=1 Tax=Monosiga brevicollis TaxID=81824 RepID=A9V6B3_MONBE|nr:uncharacterized protein MONBRDRAFT_27787 [Monosiga brevicollis MX1]EDQ86961.1 predicted protein [Monosiga brevicollis MX1]|eukprot:XP_001748200.1 hypothetical protein [Monosiga brevicollis MX1]